MYELKTEKFSGPIEKLLEMIEEKKMEITDLNLADVTADFLEYLNKIKEAGELEPRVLADFIVVASHLILIKSKALLPSLELSGEEEQEIEKLKDRIRFYREFKPTMALLKKRWEEKNISVSRPLFAGRPTIFYPADNIALKTLQKSLEEIFKTLKELENNGQPLESSLIKLEEKIEEIMKKLTERGLDFDKMAKERGKPEVIVMFLAILHLLARHAIKAEQKSKFSGIMIKKVS